MIEGITILNTYTENNLVFGLVFGFISLCLLGLSIWLLCTAISDHSGGGAALCTFLILACTGMATLSFYKAIAEPTVTYYQATLDDSVSYTEFTKQYEIIDQEGKIYTIKEKTK